MEETTGIAQKVTCPIGPWRVLEVKQLHRRGLTGGASWWNIFHTECYLLLSIAMSATLLKNRIVAEAVLGISCF